MTEGLISCVVPVRNGARYIGETLESIFSQTYNPLEVLVIDDGSTDSTRNRVSRFGRNVRYIYYDAGNNVAARNRGIIESQGEFIAFLDADDLWRPQKLTLQIEHLRANPHNSICVCHVQNFVSQDAVKIISDAGPYGAPVPGFVNSALLAPRYVFDLLGLFDESIRHSAELDWFLRARAQFIRTGLLKEILVDRRLHGSNLSITQSQASCLEYLRVVRAALKGRYKE